MDPIFEDQREEKEGMVRTDSGLAEGREGGGFKAGVGRVRGGGQGLEEKAEEEDDRKPAASGSGGGDGNKRGLLSLKDVTVVGKKEEGGANSPGGGRNILESINTLMKSKKIAPPELAKGLKKLKLPKGLKPSKKSIKGVADNSSREISRLLVNARRGELLSLSSIVVSMVAELYPISPHYNIGLAFFSMYLHNLTPVGGGGKVGGEGKRNKFYAEYEQPAKGYFSAFALVVCLSVFVDIDFLSSYQRPHNVGSDLNFNTFQGPSDLQNVCYVAVGINMFLKAGITYNLTSQFKSGVRLQRRLWKPLKYFVPTVNMPRKAKIRDVIMKRLMAIAWIELISFVAMLVLSIVAAFALTPYPHFINDSAGLPLTLLMALKAVTSLLTTMSLLKNTDLGDFVKEFGCVRVFGCKRWYKHRKKRLKEKRGFSAPKVIVDEDYLAGLRGTKFLDMGMGLWVWIGLGWALRLSR